MRYIIVILVIFVIAVFLYQAEKKQTVPTLQQTAQPQVLGKQTKSSNCLAHNGLQDSACTPGDIFPNATKTQICIRGYSKSVRNVPQQIKDAVYAEYGITSHKAGEYEVDHLISLELGGSNDISNLWPEAATPKPGFHEKDAVENYLHEQVCNGRLSLQQAQSEIANNWVQVYHQIPNPQKFNFNNRN